MSFTGETDERMPCVHSPDEASGGGGNAEGSEPLKKGPWTAVEDAILVDHVIRHGEGNWNAVQKNTGLARCGKSCRLRWANHLRPDLKKGKFTPDEERQIIELQATMGNKWARIAAQMPGRTDNEIKNFWNTRIKRRLRLGLPVYPHHISLLASQNRHQEEESGGASSSAVSQHPGASTTNSSNIPAVEFKNLELDKLLYPPSLVETYFVPTMHPPKRTRGSKKPAFLSGSNGDLSRASSQYQSNTSSLLAQPLGFSPYNHSNDDHHRSFPGSHSPSNGNSTSSGPAWTSKLELPSLQIQNLPSLESVDTLILSLPARHGESSNSGLLDAVLYGSQAMNAGNSQSQTMNASEDNSHQQQETSSDAVNNLWETCGDPISPLSHFTASLFSDYAPASWSSLHELPSTARMPGCKVKQENDGLRHLDDTSNQMIFSRPDGKNPVALKDASDAGFYDDYGWDSKRICSVGTSSGQPCGRDSCAWDATSSAM